MVAENIKIPQIKPRVVICSAGSMSAGDLAALLIRDFSIERVRTFSSLLHAMKSPAQALILFVDQSHMCQSDITEMTNRLKSWETRIVVIGKGIEPRWKKNSKRIKFFAEVPDCQRIIEALGGLSPLEEEAI